MADFGCEQCHQQCRVVKHDEQQAQPTESCRESIHDHTPASGALTKVLLDHCNMEVAKHEIPLSHSITVK